MMMIFIQRQPPQVAMSFLVQSNFVRIECDREQSHLRWSVHLRLIIPSQTHQPSKDELPLWRVFYAICGRQSGAERYAVWGTCPPLRWDIQSVNHGLAVNTLWSSGEYRQILLANKWFIESRCLVPPKDTVNAGSLCDRLCEISTDD